MPLVIFTHGNSFPGSTYRFLLDRLRERGFQVEAIEKVGHDERYPVSSNWPHLVQQVADFTREHVEKTGEPAFMVGHSLGGFLSLMAAARNPTLARGVLMLDSPVLGGWRATTLGMAKTTQLIGSISPGAVSRRRRNSWASREEALAHFQHKKTFARWHPQALLDYVEHGMHDEGDKRVLSFDRDIETQIYNTLPHNLDRLLLRHPLQCPVAFIGGIDSVEMRQVGMTMTRRVTEGRIMMLDGSHLFPMEQPLATAAAIEASLLNLQQLQNLHAP